MRKQRKFNELRERTKEFEARVSQPINTATIRFKLHFKTLVKGSLDLLSTLEEIKEVDVYKKAVSGLLSKGDGQMAWIESNQQLARHPKVKKAARTLEISVPTVVGHLHFLWW